MTIDIAAVIRVLEQDALALIATFPAEAIRFAWLASVLRTGMSR